MPTSAIEYVKLTLVLLATSQQIHFLCHNMTGRGGAINSHIGNKTFREWVRVRKEEYNLAPCKAEKAKVAKEVMDLVKSLDPPGRFLMQDPTCSSTQCWWIEVDETKALAKTCQALREGAPRIRAAHKDELEERARKPKRRKSASTKRPTTTAYPASNTTAEKAPIASSYVQPIFPSSTTINVIPSGTTTEIAMDYLRTADAEHSLASEAQGVDVRSSSTHIVAPLMSNREFEETYGRPAKRVRVEDEQQENQPPFSATAETPPLVALPSPRVSIPPIMRTSSRNGLTRINSLALTEISTGDYSGWDGEFVNPFADETDVLWMGYESSSDPPNPSWNVFSSNGNGSIPCQ